MERGQLSFFDQLVPTPKGGMPLTREQKLKLLAQQTSQHELPRNNAERVEQVREITKRK